MGNPHGHFEPSAPRGAQEAPRGSQEALKRLPRDPQDAPRDSLRHPRHSRRLLGPPRRSQDAPRGLQAAPKRYPKRLREASKRPLAILLALLLFIFFASRAPARWVAESTPGGSALRRSGTIAPGQRRTRQLGTLLLIRLFLLLLPPPSPPPPPSKDNDGPAICSYTSLIISTRLGIVSGWAGGDTRNIKRFGYS